MGWNMFREYYAYALSFCQDHDDCYREQGCNATSWLTVSWDTSFGACNRAAAQCILLAIPVYHLCREVCRDKQR